MNLPFSTSRLTPKLLNNRLIGYRWIATGQLFVMVSFLFFYELLRQFPFAYWQEWLVLIIGTVMLGMNVITYRLIKELTNIKLIQRAVLFLMCSGVIMSIFTGLGFFEKGESAYKIISTLSIFFTLLSFIILLYLMVFDIFNEKHEIAYRLWGSACIYLLLGATFGLIYTLFGFLLPSQFHFNQTFDLFRFIPCYNFSFYTLAGIDPPFEGFGVLVRNISVIESILSNLYIVLVVGRLLSK